MSIYIRDITEVRRRVQMAFPEGGDETSTRQIPILLKYIDELELALLPFARLGLGSPMAASMPLNFQDCKNAAEVLTDKSPAKKFEFPAE